MTVCSSVAAIAESAPAAAADRGIMGRRPLALSADPGVNDSMRT
jgi:hypothetical protein